MLNGGQTKQILIGRPQCNDRPWTRGRVRAFLDCT